MSIELLKNLIERTRAGRDFFITELYNRETKQWMQDGRVGSAEFTERCQAAVRAFNWTIQNAEEEIYVTQLLAERQKAAFLDKKFSLLYPLVSRRHSNAEQKDGQHFQFDKATLYTCLCTFSESISTEHEIELRKNHEDALIAHFDGQETIVTNAGVTIPTTICQTYSSEKISVGAKHKRGDISCRGCLLRNLEKISNPESGPLPQSEVDIRFCPRFLSLLRKLPYDEYVDTVKQQNTCYAGLLHSQMRIDTVDGKTLLTMRYLCDTCAYEESTQMELAGYSVTKTENLENPENSV